MTGFYSDGGFYMHPILLIGMLGLVVGILQLVLVRRANLIGLIVGTSLWTLLLGVMGAVIGLIQAFDAVSTAPPEMKSAMMAMSVAIAVHPTIFALIFVLLQAVVGSVAATLRLNLAPR